MNEKDLRYTKDHEWCSEPVGGISKIGISDYAQAELGDIVFVELAETGRVLEQGEVASTVESVKAASDVYAPISGTIHDINKNLIEKPELINSDSYGEGWIFKLIPDDVSELETLLDAEQYDALNPDEEN